MLKSNVQCFYVSKVMPLKLLKDFLYYFCQRVKNIVIVIIVIFLKIKV